METFWGCSSDSLCREPERFYAMVHEEDRERIRSSAQFGLTKACDDIFRVVRQDNVERWLRQKSFPILDAQGSITHIYGVLSDISEQLVLEQRNEKLEAELRHSLKLGTIGELAGGITHDFNNILGSIIGFTEMAIEDLEQESLAHQNLKEVLTAAARAKGLVGQILTFSRRAVRNIRAVDFAELVKEALKLMQATLPSTIEIQSEISEQTYYVMGDSDQLHSMVVNLCTNAGQAMQLSGGTLRIQLKFEKHTQPVSLKVGDLQSEEVGAGEYLRLCIGDTGAGMDQSTMDNIFEPFYTTKALGKGTGLGLAVVQRVVGEHGGAIGVSSVKTQGSEFSVLLPVSSMQPDSELTTSLLPTKGKGRILFVDDEAALVSLAKLMLEGLGYTVQAYCNPIEALNDFRTKPDSYDLVITDVTMPHLPGDQLGQRIHELRADIPIVLCSGYTDRIDYDEALRQGFAEFVSKPLNFARLSRVVQLTLGQSKGIGE